MYGDVRVDDDGERGDLFPTAQLGLRDREELRLGRPNWDREDLDEVRERAGETVLSAYLSSGDIVPSVDGPAKFGWFPPFIFGGISASEAGENIGRKDTSSMSSIDWPCRLSRAEVLLDGDPASDGERARLQCGEGGE